jgi:hypothetical protein
LEQSVEYSWHSSDLIKVAHNETTAWSQIGEMRNPATNAVEVVEFESDTSFVGDSE